jgi:fusion and transport protein UGO1
MDPPDSSSYATYARITTSRDAPNPLRPYYVPPSIGLPEPNASSHHHHPDASYSIPSSRANAASSSSSSSNRDFRELFSDLDYGDYMPEASPGVADMAKRLVDQAIWNYTSVVMAQPFEVAKVVLQCHAAGAGTVGLGGEREGRAFEGYDAEVSLILS